MSRGKQLPIEKQREILEDLAKAAEYAENAKEHSLDAIAARRGVHKRTIQKLMTKLGVEHRSAGLTRLRSMEYPD